MVEVDTQPCMSASLLNRARAKIHVDDEDD